MSLQLVSPIKDGPGQHIVDESRSENALREVLAQTRDEESALSRFINVGVEVDGKTGVLTVATSVGTNLIVRPAGMGFNRTVTVDTATILEALGFGERDYFVTLLQEQPYDGYFTYGIYGLG